MPYLRVLSLKIRDNMSWGRRTNTYTLAPLHRLEFSGHIDSIGQLMGLLRVPNLADLSIVDCAFQLPSSLQPLTDMLRRSSCRLERLNISYASYEALVHPDHTKLLSYLSTLRELHIHLAASGGFERILKHLQNAAVFPQLRALHLAVFIATEVPPEPILEGIVDLVKVRRQGDSQLSVLSIDTTSHRGLPEPKLQVTTPAFRQLLELQEDGLELVGRVVEGRWCPSYSSSSHWGFEGDEQLQSRFGFPDELEK
ncbi:hypothetical protein PM082_021203 [Marasmius tenuissimus]|nr:hypothetical protein PM082_021203 [Marasmius tenuissimus]